jgi:hypothetical protein
MKKGLLPEGFSLRKITTADRKIAAYMTSNFSEASSYADISYLEEVVKCCEDTTDSFIVIDPEGKAVGYAEIYH